MACVWVSDRDTLAGGVTKLALERRIEPHDEQFLDGRERLPHYRGAARRLTRELDTVQPQLSARTREDERVG